MKRILGLDLGTNSIGWAVVDVENENFKLQEKGVRIFQEGVKIEKGNESSKAAERTTHRSARRIKFRRKLRKIRTLEVLVKHNLCPHLSTEELNRWRYEKQYPIENDDFFKWLLTDEENNRNPYYFRSKAAIEKRPLHEVGRALYHLAQRRGFLSNRLETTKESDGAVKQGISDLTKKINESGCKTLGQYFNLCYQDGEKIRDHYTHREEHYLKEFNIICEVQEFSTEIINELEKAIFFQRPLKSQKGLVGNCIFEKNKARCPVSHPDFEEYRMLCFINNIRIKTPNDEKLRTLSEDEIKKIIPLFHRKSKSVFEFNDIAKKLTPNKHKAAHYKSKEANIAHVLFNYNLKTTVNGCPTTAGLIAVFGEEWKNEIFKRYSNKTTKSGIKTIDDVITDVWHVLFSFDNNEKLKEFAQQKLMLDEDQINKFINISIKTDYAQLSLKAIRKILPFLKEGMIYSYATFLANIEDIVGKEIWNDKENQDLIFTEIKNLIDTHNFNARLDGIVNDLIKNCKNNGYSYGLDELLVNEYKKDVTKKLEVNYGKEKWNSFSEDFKNKTINNTFLRFQNQLEKNNGRGEYLKIKRLDERIKFFLISNFPFAEQNLKKLYHPSDMETFKRPSRAKDGNFYLGSPRVASIKNPMAMRSMFQLRLLINTLIKKDIIDENTTIHIELARELNDMNKRKAIQTWQRDREEKRKKYKKEIADLLYEECGRDTEPSDTDILKYQLWEEQNHICLYTGKQIRICDFIGDNPSFDIEHTIPRSFSYDNSQENLTLCDNEFNRNTKGQKLPSELANHDEILFRISKWEETYIELDKLIERAKRGSKGSSTKEQKDFFIQKRHKLTLERNYWKGKYHRFTTKNIPEGFKNSQLVDIGIISKYAQQYLKSVFTKVYTVKGTAVAEFRKIWGVQDNYSKKERVSHIHHCVDAITIACMTKNKYDILTNYYHELEQWELYKGQHKPSFTKPWATFVEDVKKIENEVLVSHYTPNNIPKPTKKKLRTRGKIQYNENGEIKYQQGDSVRGALHKDTIYGKIKGIDKKGNEAILCVVRKALSSLSAGDIKNIVDPVVREKVEDAINQKGLKTALNETIWMNQEKGIKINKVRCYTPTVTNPIALKKHRDISRHDYKQHINVANDGNYLMAIYEGQDKKGNTKRDFELLNMLEAGEYYKSKKNKLNPLVPLSSHENNYPLLQEIKVGSLVLLYEEKNSVWDLSKSEISKSLYKVVGLSSMLLQKKYHYGVIILRYHLEARPSTEMKVKDGDFKLKDEIIPLRKLLHTRFNALVEGIDFKLTPLGEIIQL